MIIRSCLVGFAALAVTLAQAQVKPIFWIWDRATSTFTDDQASPRDSRFREVVSYHMKWGISHPRSAGNNLAYRSGAATGTRIAQEVKQRQFYLNSDFVILIQAFGMRGIENDKYTSTYSYSWGDPPNPQDEGEGVFPSLYANSADMISVPYPQGTRDERTLWTNTGMENMKNWTADFLAAYNVAGAPQPKRLVFDQEIPIPIMRLSWDRVCAYWQAMKVDHKWWDRPVPGFGGKTMDYLWSYRPSDVTDPDPVAIDELKYKGGTAANQRWFVWFVNVFSKAYAATMDYAVYGKVDAYWPGTTCGDYNSTVQLDGALGEYEYPANAMLDGSFTGGLSKSGTRYAFEAPGTNVFSNPNFYNAANGYIWGGFKTVNRNNWARWANTDDNHNPTYGLVADGKHAPRWASNGDEFWSDTIARQNRFYADGLVRSNPGTKKDIVAWITLPNQPHWLPAIDGYDGQSYVQDPFVREPLSATYRTLAMCRARGINEFILWFDTGFDVDTVWGNYNRGLHGNYQKNWDKLRRAADLVWAYDATDFYVIDGINQLPQHLTDSEELDRISKSDLNYTNIGAQTVQVDAPANYTLWAVTAWKNVTGVAAPQYLNFEYEVRLNKATSAYLYIYDAYNNRWLTIGTSGGFNDADGRAYPVTTTPDKTMRLRARIPYSPKFVDSAGKIRVAFSTTPTSTPTTAYFDLTQCYGSDAGLRQMGDWNGDGELSPADDELFHTMWNRAVDPALDADHKAMNGMWNLDLDHDGDIDDKDKLIWEVMWDDGLNPDYDWDRANWRKEYIDDARQVANDLRPKP